MRSERLHRRQMEALTRDERLTPEVFLVQESLRLYRFAQRSGTPGEVGYQRAGVREAVHQLRERRQDLAMPQPREQVIFSRTTTGQAA